MIILSQYLVRYFILGKILSDNHVKLELTHSYFGLLVFSTVLIAAAGYIINDYFDLKTDLINRPDTVVVDKMIKRRVAIILHISFTLFGLILGVYCALKAGYLRLAIFHIAAAVLLWFYSTNFKKQLLIGNIVVSFLTAAIIFIPFVYELGLMQHNHPGFADGNWNLILSCFKATLIFSLFAFITSMAREIIKDMEDMKGDRETGGFTMPIYWGMHASKIGAFFLILITQILLFFVIYNTYKFKRTIFTNDVVYIIITLLIPLSILLLLITKANKPNDYKRASLLLKFIMLMGLGFSLVFYFL